MIPGRVANVLLTAAVCPCRAEFLTHTMHTLTHAAHDPTSGNKE